MSLLNYDITIDDIDFKKIAQKGKKVVTLDIDNTLFFPKKKLTDQKEQVTTVIHFLASLKEQGFHIVIISNNFAADREQFFQSQEIPHISFALKPFPFAWNRVRTMFPQYSNKSDFLHIGDQLLTDGLGAQLAGIDYMLIRPLDKKSDLIFALPSRMLERLFFKKRK